MGKRLTNMMAECFVVLFAFSLFGCNYSSKKVSADNTFEDYKYIVSQGEKSLSYMLNKFANSNNDGLEEYVMAIACSEILEENPSAKTWSSGREWC